MNFQESLDYLYGLGYELSVKKFGLENTLTLLDALGNPEKNYLKIQVAGTNGKGSTCAFLESILIAADIKAGKYTSPHLVSITERICVDGLEISEQKFAEYATRIRKISEELVSDGTLTTLPTFFEQVTAIALIYFAEKNVEIAILETGLGGRFDSTTAAKSEIVAFTPIDLDHQNILGTTLKEIASEKAAIIRPDTVVFSTVQQTEAKNIFYGKCRESGVEPIWALPEVRLIDDLGFGLHYLSFKTKNAHYKTEFWMQGKHQWTNAALAIYIAEYLDNFNFQVSKDDIEIGIANTKHKGRLEFYEGLLFDGAHNISGAEALRAYLDEFVQQPVTMIFGSMKDKDLTEISDILFPKADRLILTKPDNPRSMEISELEKFVPSEFPKINLFLCETATEALQKARELSNENDLILVTGSLYLVGEIQKLVKI